MNKIAKNIIIATTVLLGTSYILDKTIKSKKRQPKLQAENIITPKKDDKPRFVLISEIYRELTQKTEPYDEDLNEQTNDTTGFSELDRNYYKLSK